MTASRPLRSLTIVTQRTVRCLPDRPRHATACRTPTAPRCSSSLGCVGSGGRRRTYDPADPTLVYPNAAAQNSASASGSSQSRTIPIVATDRSSLTLAPAGASAAEASRGGATSRCVWCNSPAVSDAVKLDWRNRHVGAVRVPDRIVGWHRPRDSRASRRFLPTYARRIGSSAIVGPSYASLTAATRSTVPSLSCCDSVTVSPAVASIGSGRRVMYSPLRAVNSSTSLRTA